MKDCEMTSISKNKFKRRVKKYMTDAAFVYLKSEQAEHSKIRNIKYKDLRLQPYLKSDELSHEEASTIFNMRASTVNDFKMCFPNMYKACIKMTHFAS